MTSDTTFSNTITDPYYSRTGDTWKVASREDSVVWGDDHPGPLTADDVQKYCENGFLHVPELLSGDAAAALAAEAKDLAFHWEDSTPGLIREPGSEVVRSIFRLHLISDLYRRLFRDERILGRVCQLLDSDVYIHQSRVNYKPPLDGKEFFWHSDFETWHVEDGMPRMRAISVSVFLTESHEFNGPLMLIPGSHKTFVRCAGQTPENHFQQSLKKQQYGVPGREALEDMVATGGIEAPKGLPGSVVFFDCNTMHGSNGNLSPTPRVNLFAVYNSVDNALVSPFCDRPPRPEYLAERDVQVVR